MPLFRYEALDRAGKTVVGAMQVSDERTLSARLASMGYRPTRIEVANRPGAVQLSPPPPAPASAPPPGAPAGYVPRPGPPAYAPAPGSPLYASREDRTRSYSAPPAFSSLTAGERSLARMFHQLHISFRAGMPAYQALTTVQGQVREPSLRRMLGEAASGVEQGQSIALQMERYPRLFSRGDVGMLRAAEMGGFLPEAFSSLAQRHEQDDNTRRRLAAFAWFFHLNFIAFLVVVACAQFFYGAAAGAGAPDAGLRSGLEAIQRGLLTITLPGTVLYILALLAFERCRRHPAMARAWHRLLLRMPVAGKINFLRTNAVFTMALAQLYRAGVVADRAWEAAAGAAPNLYLSERLLAAKPAVEATQRFSAGLQSCGLMDLADVGMVATGEAAGDVDQALGYLAVRYEEDTRVALGASVLRGAVGFTLLAFLTFALAEAFLARGYYGQMFQYVEKLVGGTGE